MKLDELRAAWAPSPPVAHAEEVRRTRHVVAAIAMLAFIGIVVLSPLAVAQRPALAVLLVTYGVVSGAVRNRIAVRGGRVLVEPAMTAALAVALMMLSVSLGVLAMGLVLAATVRAAAMRGLAAAGSILLVADLLLLVVALVAGVPSAELSFAALVHPLIAMTAAMAVYGAVHDHHRSERGRARVDDALASFGGAGAGLTGAEDAADAVRAALDVLLDGSVSDVVTTFAVDDAAALDERPQIEVRVGHAQDISSGLVPTEVSVPARVGENVVGRVEFTSDRVPSIEEQRMLEVLADRVGVTLLAEAALAREHSARLELEEAKVLRDQIMARVTHDLRSPLSSITGSVFTLTQYGHELPAETVQRLYTLLERNAERVSTWMQSLLDHAVHGEELDLAPEPIAVAELLSAGVEAANELLAELVVVEEPIDAIVYVDRTAVTRVLLNLLSNAAKYAPAGSTVEVRAEAIGGDLTVLVCDHGPGIEGQDEPHVFEPFYRSTQQPVGVHGTGVGLATVHDLVAAWGGSVGHRPTRGGGATFWFTVPMRVEDAAAEPTQDATVVQIDPRRRKAADEHG